MNDVQKDKLEILQNYNTYHEGIFLPNRQVGFAVAGILLFSCFVFIAGYFFGQQRAIEPFSNKAEQDSLADIISSSIYSLYDKGEDEIAEEENDPMPLEESSPLSQEDNSLSTSHETTNAVIHQEASTLTQENIKTKQYYAELIGFGSLSAAQAFVQKLSKKGIDVTIKTRTSTSARGRTISWYQVVTPLYESQQELTSLVDMIKYSERIKGIRMVSC